MFDNISSLPEHPDVIAQIDAVQVQTKYLTLRRQGFSLDEARQQTKLNLSDRSLRRLEQQVREEGISALIDLRKLSKGPAAPLTPEVEEISLSLWMKLPAAPDSLLLQRIVERCQQRSLPPPTKRQFKRFLAERSPAEITERQKNRKKQESQFHPVIKIEEVAARNQLWQTDTQFLDIWVKLWCVNDWIVFRPYLQATLDAASRCFTGGLLLPSPATAWSTLTLLRQAIYRKLYEGWPMAGLFHMLEMDNGAENKNKIVACALKAISIKSLFDFPYYPNSKGKMERVFRTIDQGVLRGLPGHIKAIGVTPEAARRCIGDLLTFEQLEAILLNWIIKTYHHRRHSTLQMTPYECWQQDAAPLIIPSLSSLNLALVSGVKTHQVSNQGIRWQQAGMTTIFWAPELIPLIGQPVKIFYDPSKPTQIEILHPQTGDLICLAKAMGGDDDTYSLDDVKQARRADRAQQVKQAKKLRKSGKAHLQAILNLAPPAQPDPPKAAPSNPLVLELEHFFQQKSREEF